MRYDPGDHLMIKYWSDKEWSHDVVISNKNQVITLASGRTFFDDGRAMPSTKECECNVIDSSRPR